MRELHPPAEYRAKAADCERRAEYATSEKHRMILLDTAQTWRRLADAAEVISKVLKTLEATRAPIKRHRGPSPSLS